MSDKLEVVAVQPMYFTNIFAVCSVRIFFQEQSRL